MKSRSPLTHQPLYRVERTSENQRKKNPTSIGRIPCVPPIPSSTPSPLSKGHAIYLHSYPLLARGRKHLLPVRLGLVVEAVHGRHGNNANASAQLGRGVHGVLHLRAGSHEDEFERALFFLRNVTALQRSFPAGLDLMNRAR